MVIGFSVTLGVILLVLGTYYCGRCDLPPVLTGPAHMHTRTCTAATAGVLGACAAVHGLVCAGVCSPVCHSAPSSLASKHASLQLVARQYVLVCSLTRLWPCLPYAHVAVSGSGRRPRQEAGSQVPVVAARASPPGAWRAGLGWQHHPGAQGGLCGRAARCAGVAGTGCTPVTRPDTSAQK